MADCVSVAHCYGDISKGGAADQRRPSTVVGLPRANTVTGARHVLLGTASVAALACFFATTLDRAQAQTYTWGGSGSTTSTTAYKTGTNWSTTSPGAPPVAAGQTGVFGTTGRSTVVVAGGAIAPDAWRFTAASKAFGISGANVNFGGAGIVDNSTQTESIANTIKGTGGVAQAGSGTLVLSGTGSTYSGNTTVSGGRLAVTGAITSAGKLTNSATVTVASGATLAVASATNTGTLNSTGTLSTTNGLSNAKTVDASGTIDGAVLNKAGGTFTTTGTLTGNASFTNATGGKLAVNPGSTYSCITTLTNAGSVSVANTGTLQAATIDNTTGTIRSNGTLSATTIDNTSGTIVSTGTLTTTGGAGLVNTKAVDAAGQINGKVFNNAGGTFAVTGTLADNGSTFRNADGATLSVGGHSFTGVGLITNGGLVRVGSGGTLSATGLTNSATGMVVNNGTIDDALNNAGTVNNNGTYNANVASNSGTINNNSGGRWNGDVDGNSGTINNSGTWKTTSATGFHTTGTLVTTGTLDVRANGGQLVNKGTVKASGTLDGPVDNQAGTFTVTRTLSGDSTFNNHAGATLAIDPGAADTGITTLTNAGTVAVAATGKISAVTINNTTGTLTSNGTVVANTIDNASGTIVSTGVLTTTGAAGLVNTGTVDASGEIKGKVANNAGGTVTATGTLGDDGSAFANAAGATLTVGGHSFTGIGALANAGTASVDTGGTLGATTINNTGALLSKGTLQTTSGLANAGTLKAQGNIDGPVTNKAGGTVTVTGTLVDDGSAFANAAGATLTVGGHSFTGIGTLGNAGSASVDTGGTLGATTIANTGTLVSKGTLETTNGLANAKTVNAQGTIDGPVINKAGGTFTVTGALVDNDKAFSNADGATLTVTSGGRSFTGVGQITNGGLVQVGSGSSLTADGLSNTSTGRVVNAGTIKDDLNNAGTVDNNGTYDARVASNSGSITNAGTWNGDVATSTGTIVNAGTWTTAAGGFTTSGTLRTTGVLNAGAAASGLTNSGAVMASGTIDGAINNMGGTFTVTGPLTGNAAFVNATGATLAVDATSYTAAAATLTNAGTVLVATGGTLTMGTIDNTTGTIKSNGLLQATTIDNVGGTIASTGTLSTAGGLTNSKFVQAAGTVDGPVFNEAGGSFALSGALAGDSSFDNAAGATLALGSHAYSGLTTLDNMGVVSLGTGVLTVAGGVTNEAGGTFTSVGGSVVAPVFNNAGTISMHGGGATDLTTINGNYAATGNATLSVDINVTKPNATSDQLVVTGTGSGTTLVDFANHDGGATFSKTLLTFTGGTLINPTPVITIKGGGTATFVPVGGQQIFGSNGGLVQYALQKDANNPLQYDIVSGVNTSAITPIGTALSSTFGAITSSFFQSSGPFVVPGPAHGPDQWSGGPWIRISGGATTIDATGMDTTLHSAARVSTDTTFEGFQAGVDTGAINIKGSGTNVFVGLTGGYVNADSADQGNTTRVNFSIPFVGVYGAIQHDAFAADVTYRHDFGQLTVNSTGAVAANSPLSAAGDSVYGNLLYAVGANGYTILPSLGLGYSHYDVGALKTLAGGPLTFSNIDSLLGRLGVQIGKTVKISDTLVIQPFVTGAVWHEFEGDTIARFQDGVGLDGKPLSDTVATTRVGTFGQIGVGMSTQILPVGFTGFVRGDFRFGDKLNGQTGTLGVRYSF